MSTRIAIVAGTRPEAIKLIPVYKALEASDSIVPVFISAGQHRAMLQSVFDAFDFEPEVTLEVMTEDQSLSSLMSRLSAALSQVLEAGRFQCVVVQGDTSTALIAALIAHYMRLQVAHVEAGLRTHDKWAPFPEETHRRMIAAIADMHFAATDQAVAALRAENVVADVFMVGNTVVDALQEMRGQILKSIGDYESNFRKLTLSSKRYILLTTHRRENFGIGLENICKSVLELVNRFESLSIIFCVHLNPNVHKLVHLRLGQQERVFLIEPQPYDAMVHLMMGAWLILTDSGGLQEEAPSLNVPVFVMRDRTERPEGVAAGCAKLVGTDSERIISEVSDLWTDEQAYARMTEVANPYGDGMASIRIASILESRFGEAVSTGSIS